MVGDHATVCRLSKREREREYLAGSCYLQYCVYPTIFPCFDPRSQLSRFFRESPAGDTCCYVFYVASVKASPAHTVGDRQGQLVYEYCKSSHCKLNLCYVTYIYNERKESGERERERETERVPCRIMLSKNPGLAFSARRSHVIKICQMLTCSSERKYNNKKNKNKNKEISRLGLVFLVEYLQNGKRYSSSVLTKNQGQESCYQMVQTTSL